MNSLEQINIKNITCYFFDDKVKFEDFDVDYILIEVKFCIFNTKIF